MSTVRRGIAAVRYTKARFNGGATGALAYAESQDWRNTPEVALVLRGAASTITGAENPGLLGDVGTDLSAFIRPRSIVGRLQGMRQVPLRTRIITGTGGATAHWVGESQPAPITATDFDGIVLPSLKVVAIAVVSQELLRNSSPKADATIENDLAAAAAEALDVAFIDPANGGIAGVAPASITHGATVLASSGSSVAQIDADLAAMVGQLTDADSDLAAAAWLMTPATAVALSLKRGSGGALAYPNVSAKGGELLGLPVLTTPHVGSSSSRFIVLVDAAQIAVGDADEARVEVTTDAAVQMSTTPSATSPVTMVSLFQEDSAAIKVVRYLNWHLRRPQFVSVLSGVAY